MPVNDWIKRKGKQDSKIISENHQAQILWNRAGKGGKSERFDNVNHLAITDYCQVVPLNKSTTEPKEDRVSGYTALARELKGIRKSATREV